MKKICELCQAEFDSVIIVNEVKHNICNRKMCLTCSPFKAGNNVSAASYKFKKELSGFNFCACCKTMKPTSDFYLRSDGKRNHSYCKVCQNQNVLDRQRRFKIRAIEYKGGKCCICGYDKYEGALDFHHLDPSKKDFALSAGRLRTFDSSKPELDKCVLVCSNCHRELHAGLHTHIV